MAYGLIFRQNYVKSSGHSVIYICKILQKLTFLHLPAVPRLPDPKYTKKRIFLEYQVNENERIIPQQFCTTRTILV